MMLWLLMVIPSNISVPLKCSELDAANSGVNTRPDRLALFLGGERCMLFHHVQSRVDDADL